MQSKRVNKILSDPLSGSLKFCIDLATSEFPGLWWWIDLGAVQRCNIFAHSQFYWQQGCSGAPKSYHLWFGDFHPLSSQMSFQNNSSYVSVIGLVMNHFDIYSNIHCVTSCMTGPTVGYLRSWRKSDTSNTEGGRWGIAAEMTLRVPTEAASPMKEW